jgi:hypothetical protein
MILNEQEAQITSQILKKVFSADIAPDQIKGLQVHDTEAAQTVVIVTPFALYTLGKDYFRQLVTELKPVAVAAKKPVRQAQEVTRTSSDGVNSIWQVTGETGNVYLVSHNNRTGIARCGCKAATFGRSCYHASSVKQAATSADIWQESQDELALTLRNRPRRWLRCSGIALQQSAAFLP